MAFPKAFVLQKVHTQPCRGGGGHFLGDGLGLSMAGAFVVLSVIVFAAWHVPTGSERSPAFPKPDAFATCLDAG